jgi:integrase
VTKRSRKVATGLTDKGIKAAKPRESRYTLFDTGGLYLEVAPAGGKWWRMRFRLNGKNNVMSLGTYPDVSLKMARDKRDNIRTLLARGMDPRDDKRKAQAPTFQEVMDEWFAFKEKTWNSKTRSDNLTRINNYLREGIPAKPITELETQDFLRVIRKIEAEGRYPTAHYVAGICSQVIRYAKLSGIIRYNPIDGITSLLTPMNITHHPVITDPQKLKSLLESIRSFNTSFSISLIAAMRIMPYVFVRSSELRCARWSEFDFDNALWVIPATRMKMKREHIVPLASQVLEMFKTLRNYLGDRTELCFPNFRFTGKPINKNSMRLALRRMGYASGELCVHSFRGIASTCLNEMGYRPDLIEMQLAHVENNKVRAAYNHALYLEERREMMQRWADYLDSLLEEPEGVNANTEADKKV